MKKQNNLSKHPIYKVWSNMKHRCYNNSDIGYKYYGERGIIVCDEWKEFMSFYNWAMVNGYKRGLTLDRINNNGNYEPDNCRFTTWSIQNKNKRKHINLNSTKQFCIDNGILHYYSSISQLLKKGRSKEWIINRYQYAAYIDC